MCFVLQPGLNANWISLFNFVHLKDVNIGGGKGYMSITRQSKENYFLPITNLVRCLGKKIVHVVLLFYSRVVGASSRWDHRVHPAGQTSGIHRATRDVVRTTQQWCTYTRDTLKYGWVLNLIHFSWNSWVAIFLKKATKHSIVITTTYQK